MRRIFSTIIAATVLGALAPGAVAAQGVTLGGRVGVNFAKADIDDDDGERTRRGVVLGGALGIPLHDAFAIQIEALYAQKGLVVEDDPERAVLRLNYIEVPLLARVRIPNRDHPLRPILYAGPVVSFEVECSIRIEENGVSGEAGCRDEAFGVDQLNSAAVDVGLTGGAGFELDLGRTILSLEGRYTHGLTDILENDASQIKNRVWSVIAGVAVRP